MWIEVPELGLALKEYRGATCWQMYQWATGRKAKKTGEDLPDEWVAMESYPRTLEHGLDMLLELSLRRSSVRGDLERAREEVRLAREAILAAVERGVKVDDS